MRYVWFHMLTRAGLFCWCFYFLHAVEQCSGCSLLIPRVGRPRSQGPEANKQISPPMSAPSPGLVSRRAIVCLEDTEGDSSEPSSSYKMFYCHGKNLLIDITYSARYVKESSCLISYPCSSEMIYESGLTITTTNFDRLSLLLSLLYTSQLPPNNAVCP